jgi:hypothetical protein
MALFLALASVFSTVLQTLKKTITQFTTGTYIDTQLILFDEKNFGER